MRFRKKAKEASPPVSLADLAQVVSKVRWALQPMDFILLDLTPERLNQKVTVGLVQASQIQAIKDGI